MEFFFVIIILIMSVVVHEVAHGYAALALDDPTAKYQGRLTLNPVKHLDPVGSILVPLIGFFAGGFLIGWARPVPFNPYNLRPQKWGLPTKFGEAIVAAAGPLSNIALAGIFSILIRFFSEYVSVAFLGLAEYVVLINLTLAVFNLIPIPPMDGSKIVFTFLPYRWLPIKDFLEKHGMIFVLVFVLFFWHLISPLVVWFFKLFLGL